MSGSASETEATVIVDGERYPVPPQGLRIGRAPENDVVVADPNVSRHHLVVWTTPQGAFLRDLGSQNGTLLGGERVGAGPISIPLGARVRLGHTDLRVELRTVPAPRRPGGRATNVGLVLGGVTLVLLGLMVVTGMVVYRTVSGATPTPVVAKAATPTQATLSATSVPKPTTPATPVPTPAPTSVAGGRDPGLVRALNGAVRISMPAGFRGSGSGTVITPRGHILTNYHVVSDDNLRLINQGNGFVVSVPPTEGEPAKPKYLARYVDGDPKLDFALLRIVSLEDGRPIPADLGLAPVPIGNSDSVRIGDPFVIVGYPGLGGASVTVTRGIMSGMTEVPNEPGRYFKTDTEISPGSSGGTAINAAGDLVGVPTAGRFDPETVGKLGLIRPINLAKPLIDKANQDR